MSPQEKPPTEVPWGETVSHPARRSPKGIPHKIAYWRYPPLTGVACVARTRRAPLDETVTFVDGKLLASRRRDHSAGGGPMFGLVVRGSRRRQTKCVYCGDHRIQRENQWCDRTCPRETEDSGGRQSSRQCPADKRGGRGHHRGGWRGRGFRPMLHRHPSSALAYISMELHKSFKPFFTGGTWPGKANAAYYQPYRGAACCRVI